MWACQTSSSTMQLGRCSLYFSAVLCTALLMAPLQKLHFIENLPQMANIASLADQVAEMRSAPAKANAVLQCIVDGRRIVCGMGKAFGATKFNGTMSISEYFCRNQKRFSHVIASSRSPHATAAQRTGRCLQTALPPETPLGFGIQLPPSPAGT